MFCQDCGSSTTACISGDCFGGVREVDLADLKQEPDGVCCVLCPVSNYCNILQTLAADEISSCYPLFLNCNKHTCVLHIQYKAVSG